MTDEQVRAKGTPVEVKIVEDLAIYHGKIKPVFSAPCENWYEDIDPPAAIPSGCIAVRQLNSGCLAFIAKDKLETSDRSENEHEENDLSEKRRRWRWDATDVIELIISFIRPPW
ncbi:MAG: hypothetical protein OXH31_00205 [Gammaproteobacteria bacterium]|nr:hypothetical protein [Gammaproteobacteria bacterium]